MLDLAKAQIADRIAELEQEHAEAAAAEFDEWKAGLEAQLAKAIEQRSGLEDRPESRGYREWDKEVQRVEGELADAEAKRTGIEERSAEALEEAIAAEARKHYKDVLAEAVDGTRFTLRDLPTHSVQLSSKPRFRQRYAEDVQFLYGDEAVTELQADEVTDILEDATGRALHLAQCTAREQAQVSDLTRRQMMEARDRFAEERIVRAMAQSFSDEALEKRWGLQRRTTGPDDEIAAEAPNSQEEEGK